MVDKQYYNIQLTSLPGQARLRHGDKEVRFEQNDPFPLYPGEQLIGDMTPLQVVK
jgi:major vault protein